MGRAPAVIIIARHGARLDAEDSKWINNSSTPYDPPLTYGGWLQTRALGARVGSLLRQRDVTLNHGRASKRRSSEDLGAHSTEPAGQENVPVTAPKRRKHKVIIHTSPFLRCIQSSISICAGMAQYQGNLARFEAVQTSKAAAGSSGSSGPSRSKTLDSTAFESAYGTTPQSKISSKSEEQDVKSRFTKPTLRVDACLGEWLCPDYYEGITPPPSSSKLVASAKAELFGHSTPLQGARTGEHRPLKEPDAKLTAKEKESLSLRGLSEALPNQEDSTELKTANNAPATEDRSWQLHQVLSKGYAPPVPTYAIAGSNPIPPGFVSHARDACTQIDVEWDSMKPPQSWGDGGEYGEEWSSMHRRFRKGLMDMITWYKQRGPYFDPQADAASDGESETMDDDEDIVLVLVTHGAGCNALIGALTNQPVLLDVGMGSLTMAVRRESLLSSAGQSRMHSAPLRRMSSVDTSQADEYEIKLTASTEHLRAGNDPLKIPQLMSPAMLASIPEIGGRDSAPRSGTSTPAGHDRPRNSALGSMRRSRATTTGAGRSGSNEYVLLSPSSDGLWSSRQSSAHSFQAPIAEENEIEELSLDGQAGKSSDESAPAPKSPQPKGSGSHKGLWGAPSRKPPARRWTVNEHD